MVNADRADENMPDMMPDISPATLPIVGLLSLILPPPFDVLDMRQVLPEITSLYGCLPFTARAVNTPPETRIMQWVIRWWFPDFEVMPHPIPRCWHHPVGGKGHDGCPITVS